ncbi:hypothetical protein EDB92DRAFT_1581808 [Lactarius akahatsu]|uniref:FHA domain-containing protein n=1 Tax=Lactarius akahatsu TaxID=416441 RepID=A0AAD4QFW5_9AGAM|nr:hypothetical protein EDB92DRAFT_1581808 [Lactarius akahatsu]
MIEPFVSDFESTNGTHVNGKAIPTSRYYKLKVSNENTLSSTTKWHNPLHASRLRFPTNVVARYGTAQRLPSVPAVKLTPSLAT